MSDEQLVAESPMRALSLVVLKILEGGRLEVRCYALDRLARVFRAQVSDAIPAPM